MTLMTVVIKTFTIIVNKQTTQITDKKKAPPKRGRCRGVLLLEEVELLPGSAECLRAGEAHLVDFRQLFHVRRRDLFAHLLQSLVSQSLPLRATGFGLAIVFDVAERGHRLVIVCVFGQRADDFRGRLEVGEHKRFEVRSIGTGALVPARLARRLESLSRRLRLFRRADLHSCRQPDRSARHVRLQAQLSLRGGVIFLVPEPDFGHLRAELLEVDAVLHDDAGTLAAFDLGSRGEGLLRRAEVEADDGRDPFRGKDGLQRDGQFRLLGHLNPLTSKPVNGTGTVTQLSSCCRDNASG